MAKSFIKGAVDGAGKSLATSTGSTPVVRSGETVHFEHVARHDGWADDLCEPATGPDVVQELPTTLTVLISGDCRLGEIHFVIPDVPAFVTILFADGSGTPRTVFGGKFGPGSYTQRFERPKVLVSLKWQASVTGVFGYVVAYQ